MGLGGRGTLSGDLQRGFSQRKPYLYGKTFTAKLCNPTPSQLTGMLFSPRIPKLFS